MLGLSQCYNPNPGVKGGCTVNNNRCAIYYATKAFSRLIRSARRGMSGEIYLLDPRFNIWFGG